MKLALCRQLCRSFLLFVGAIRLVATAGAVEPLEGVAGGNGLYVAVGTKGVILSSPDVLHWTNQVSHVTNTLRAVAFGAGQFVVVGDTGTILTSADGTTWTQQASGANRTLRAVTYGNGQFVAVGDEGIVIRSPDGVSWTNVALNTASRLTDITYAAGLFVAVAGPETGIGFGEIYISPDGLMWSMVVTILNYDLHGVTFGGGKFVVSASGVVLTSTNGVNWVSSFGGVSGPFPHLAFGNGRFVRVAETSVTFSSTNGVDWRLSYLPGQVLLRGVTFADGRFVAVGEDSGRQGVILISYEGKEWSDSLVPFFAPIITYQPNSLELYPGDSETLFVEAVGNPVPTYQWRFNGNDIPAATQSTFEVINAMAGQTIDYTVVVRNELGAVTSVVATVTVVTRAPEFTTQPQDVEAVIGGDFGLLSFAEAVPMPVYEWFFNGMPLPLPGQTNGPAYHVHFATTNHAGVYYVTASNSLGVATSRVATVKVSPLRIDNQPQSQFATSGSALQLQVGVSSTPIPSFQWFFNGAILPGANLAVLNRNPVTTNDAGTYLVVVSNVFGAVTSQVAVAGVDRMPPYITRQPQDQVALAENGASFSVGVVGTPNLLLQWRKNGSVLAGAVASSLYLLPSFNDAGAYDVVIRNSFGAVTSAVAALTVTSAPPRILFGPFPVTSRAGLQVSLWVQAQGGPIPHFQWRRNGVPLTGQTTDTLLLENASPDDSGDYDVVASNSAGSVTSQVARVTIYLVAPYFLTHPADTDALVGSAATLMGLADGAPEPTYTWCFNGVQMPGANLSYLTVDDLTTNESGLYTLIASNIAGFAVSRPATVTVRYQAPVFVQQPFGQTVLWGQPVSLSAFAEGGPPPTYQWLLNEAPIPGATTPSLYFSYATPGQSGSYRLVAGNSVGVATSGVAVVTVNAQAPVFTSQPSSRTALWGEYASFYGAASGGPPPGYQWLFNGNPIPGATNNSLPLGLVTPNQAGNYRLVAFNSSGAITSQVATLTVIQQAPLFSQEPVSQAILWGGSVTFSSLASGGPQPTYQWLFNDAPIPGATSRLLSLSSVTPTQAGNYRVLASNVVGVATSKVAVLVVNSQAPVFTEHPVNRSALWGDFVSLNASAVGGPPPTLQWLFNGEPLAGQTNNYLSLGAVTPEQAGNYSALASNAVGVVTSHVAVVVVNSQAPVFVAEPADQVVLWGDYVQFSGYAIAGPPPAHQWLFNGQPLPGETNGVLAIVGATTNHAGIYELVATNLIGSATSRMASLVVELAPPRFLQEPYDVFPLWGENVAFIAAAVGGPTPTLQWRFNGIPVPGATNSYQRFFNVTTNEAGAYDVVASNALGAVTSRVARLEVQVAAPQFSFLSAGGTVVEGTDVLLQAGVFGGPPPVLYLLFNGSPLALPYTETGGFLLTEVTTNDTGSYSFVASNFVGSVTSQVATLTVLPGGPLDHWTRRNPLPQGDTLLAVTYGSGRFVATGERGAVVSSTNGIDWRAQRLRADADLAGVAYGNGIFVSVSRAGNILTSADATQWLPRVLIPQSSIEGIAFGDGRFVAVGGDVSNLSLASTNGIDWVRGVSSVQTRFKGAAYGNGVFVGVTQGQGNWPAILVSSNGLDWITPDSSIVDNLENVAFANGQFVAVGSNGAILTSPDGVAWTRQASGVTRRLIEVAHGNGRWVAVGVRGIIVSSADGASWQNETSGTPDRLEGVTFAQGMFVALGENGTTLTSTNGMVWTKRNVGNTRDLDGIAVGPDGRIVAVGKFGTILTTPDGVHITERATGTTNDLHGVGFANGLYVAVGDGGAIVTSSNAIDWAAHTFGPTNYFKAVTFSNGMWVAVGTHGVIITSLDGYDWTVRNSGTTDDLNDVAYGNGMFIVVGDRRPPNGNVRVSTDGVSWFDRSFQTGKNLRSVTFANGLFLVVGNDGVIYTTVDGFSWQSRTSGVFGDGRNLRNATYAAGHWVVVGNDGIIITSTNAVDWTRRAPRTPENLHGVRYVNGTFVAIGNRGTILQSGRVIGPELKVREFVPGLGFVFAIEAEMDRNYILQGSEDLQTWIDLLDFNNTQSTTLFLDEEAPFLPVRFYRVITP